MRSVGGHIAKMSDAIITKRKVNETGTVRKKKSLLDKYVLKYKN